MRLEGPCKAACPWARVSNMRSRPKCACLQACVSGLGFCCVYSKDCRDGCLVLVHCVAHTAASDSGGQQVRKPQASHQAFVPADAPGSYAAVCFGEGADLRNLTGHGKAWTRQCEGSYLRSRATCVPVNVPVRPRCACLRVAEVMGMMSRAA